MNDAQQPTPAAPPPAGLTAKLIRFCLEQKLVVLLITIFVIGWGVRVAPFDWNTGPLPRDPVSVDAIPDIGEKQQIVFTEWMGRSPQDVDDQITYPLTTYLLGVPGVKTVRSYSMFGFSTIYIIFEEKTDFYWARSRVLEKLNSLPPGLMPEGVQPALGPDATALGQIFEYTLEGRDPDGKPAGGWDPQELRSAQDWYVRFALLSAEGISEVASVGGFVKEYQVDADPDAMRAWNVTIDELFAAVRASNIDVGAMTIEVNRVDYMIRGLGFIKKLSDVENAVIKVNAGVPVYVKNVATVALGPQYRRGALDKAGAEAAGGIVVVRYGHNPLAAIKSVKSKIAEIAPGMPTKAVLDLKKVTGDEARAFAAERGFESFAGGEINQDGWMKWLRATPRAEWPAWVTTSQVTLVPFYDRTSLIYETLGTLNTALYEQVLITTIVIILMAMHLRSSILISAVMPLSVLTAFIAMKLFGVDANLVSLSGIAIAIGTIVDMGIVITDNIRQHLATADPAEPRLEVVYRASSEVGSAILTAILTTVVGFLPVFVMTGPEGRLFKPLAFTKMFCLLASVIVALTIIPAASEVFFTRTVRSRTKHAVAVLVMALGLGMALAWGWWWSGVVLLIAGAYWITSDILPPRLRSLAPWVINAIAVLAVGFLLTSHWLPLGPEKGLWRNLIFVAVVIGGLQGFYFMVQRTYAPVMRFFLDHKLIFATLPLTIVIVGYMAWLGFDRIFGFVPKAAERVGIAQEKVRTTEVYSKAVHTFPGFGKEFMPPLDEGSFLYMPQTMPHASIGEALDVIRKQDMAFHAIPEVESVVGKIGRAESALDPAPIGMVETIINYRPEYITDKAGRRVRFKYDRAKEAHVRDADGELIPDPRGRPFRQWGKDVRTAGDIWKKIVAAGELPGIPSAPHLQPIAARLVMLQSGMRAPMGVKVTGPDLATIEQVGMNVERLLKEVPSIEPATVIADRVVGSPYLEIELDREAAARYGVSIRMAQDVIEMAIGGMRATTTVEGRERYPVRVRYQRELRDSIESLDTILVPGMGGAQVPLTQLAHIRYVRGPEAVKSEDTRLISYVLFDKKPGFAEVDVVEQAQKHLDEKEAAGEFVRPAGVKITFAGSYENQIHARKTLAIVLPASLFLIFMLIYFQFKSVITTGIVFSTIFVCWSGGLVMIWLYGQPWFMDFHVFGVNMRDLFQVHTINMSVAIWVGFLALFGIATDDAVLVCTYLDQRFAETKPRTVKEIREATVFAGKRRVRACLMTTATTVLAMLPVLTSTGRGADIMVPMSLPSFGGMLAEVFVMFIAAVLYCAWKERTLARQVMAPMAELPL